MFIDVFNLAPYIVIDQVIIKLSLVSNSFIYVIYVV